MRFLKYEKMDGIVILTMDRPSARNSLSDESQFEEFVQACERIRHDDQVRCVILTGSGSAFCSGGNIKHMRDKQGIAEGSPFEIQNRYRTGIQRIPTALYYLDVPTIAAVTAQRSVPVVISPVCAISVLPLKRRYLRRVLSSLGSFQAMVGHGCSNGRSVHRKRRR